MSLAPVRAAPSPTAPSTQIKPRSSPGSVPSLTPPPLTSLLSDSRNEDIFLLMYGRRWSSEEIEVLRAYAREALGINKAAKQLGRTYCSVLGKAWKLKITFLRPIGAPFEARGEGMAFKQWLWEERISPRLVRKSTGCVEWTGAAGRANYGQIRAVRVVGEKASMYQTHRVALEIRLGRELTAKEFALHSCDNPKCCCPEHLFAGNMKANVLDMMEKGRGRGQFKKGQAPLPSAIRRGEMNHFVKLDESQVRHIRGLYVPGKFGHKRIAKQLNLPRSTVGCIIARRTWKHLD